MDNAPHDESAAPSSDRPVVFFLHGWFGSADGWGDDFVAALDHDRFRHVFLDYRGYGRRRDEEGELSIDEIAADVLTAADAEGIDSFALVGHSMGGSAIQRVLALAPDRVMALVGVNPVPASGTPFDEQGRGLFEAASADDAARRTIIDITTGQRLGGRFLDSIVRHSREHSTEEAFAAYFRAWADTDHAADVPLDAVPALAIVGEHDGAITEEVVRSTWGRLHPRGVVEVIPNAGHYPMFETPVWLATVIENFLDEAITSGEGDVRA